MSCHRCLTLADCCVASCHAAAYHPLVPAPLLILVADAPLSWSLFHIVVLSLARDPPRPFLHPPWLQTADRQGKALLNPIRAAIVIIVVVLDGSASSPPPTRTSSSSSSLASWLPGVGWPPGGGGQCYRLSLRHSWCTLLPLSHPHAV